MERKFIKKARPFGQGQPPRQAPPAPDANSAPGSPVSPSNAPQQPGGSPTPPNPAKGVTEAPGGLSGQTDPNAPPPKPQSGPDMRNRQPGAPGSTSPGAGGPNVPTDVTIDMSTGAITIQKGQTNIKFTKYDPSNPPSQVSHLPDNYKRQWVHIVNKSLDAGDSEETAFKKAWGTVPDKYKKSKGSDKEAAGEWPPQEYNNDWAPDEYGGQNQIPPQPEPLEDELPPQGKFSPGESVKTRDPETGQEQYGFIVELTDPGMYRINYEDGSSRELHEGWIMDAPEAANAETAQENDPYAYRAAKVATHKDWEELFMQGNVPEYGDETTYSKDTHDNMFSHPKNRLAPPTTNIKADVPEYLNARAIAYALQTQTALDIDVDNNTITIYNVSDPLSLIGELNEYGLEARATENLTKYDQGIESFKQGMKVAMVGDYPDMNYFYNPNVPAAQAMIIGKNGNKYMLYNEQWGAFEAEEWEMAHV